MESVGNFEDYKLVYIRFLSCHLFGPVNHGQTWKGWERSGEKGLIISDNQAQTCLIITINDTSIGDLPLIITISDTCKNQPKRLDFDNTINLSSLIVSLDVCVLGFETMGSKHFLLELLAVLHFARPPMLFPNCLIWTSRTETMHSKKLKSSWVFLKLAGILPLKIVKTWSTDTGPNVI